MAPQRRLAGVDNDDKRPKVAIPHLLPAVLIGQFSVETTTPVRERTVFVARRGAIKVQRDRAQNSRGANTHTTSRDQPRI